MARGTVLIITIIISQTATLSGRAASYTPEGASSVGSQVRKMKRKEREVQINTIKKINFKKCK